MINRQVININKVLRAYQPLLSNTRYSIFKTFSSNNFTTNDKRILNSDNNITQGAKFFSQTSEKTSKAKAIDTLSLPVVDLSEFVGGKSGNISQCLALIDGLKKYGCLAIRDPRVNPTYNEEFIDVMEKYFENRGEKFYRGEEISDIKPETSYQVGATPEFVEVSREHEELVKSKFSEYPPTTPQPPPANALWRFFWRVGKVTELEDKKLPPQVIPEDFPNWQKNMDGWGDLMKDSCFTVSEMLALGFGWQKDELTKRLKGATHLLAPTGSNLARFNKEDDILSGFHYDLNFITIHGKSRYPGLYVWTREGQKMAVKVPEGCLLIQASKQLEWLTGG